MIRSSPSIFFPTIEKKRVYISLKKKKKKRKRHVGKWDYLRHLLRADGWTSWNFTCAYFTDTFSKEVKKKKKKVKKERGCRENVERKFKNANSWFWPFFIRSSFQAKSRKSTVLSWIRSDDSSFSRKRGTIFFGKLFCGKEGEPKFLQYSRLINVLERD